MGALLITAEQLQDESLNAVIGARLRPDGIYEPAPDDDPEAYPVVIAGVRPDGCCGWPIDLVAWQPAYPEQWWRRVGCATHLGDGELWRPPPDQLATWRPAPVLLVETPAQWLHEACCKAVCILDWERADVVDMFHLGRPVTFYSDRLRRAFDRRWGEIVEAGRVAAAPRYKVAK